MISATQRKRHVKKTEVNRSGLTKRDEGRQGIECGRKQLTVHAVIPVGAQLTRI